MRARVVARNFLVHGHFYGGTLFSVPGGAGTGGGGCCLLAYSVVLAVYGAMAFFIDLWTVFVVVGLL